MTLQDQCVSLPLAKRMKGLGWKQEGLFWWGYHGDCLMLGSKDGFKDKDNSPDMPIAAPTASELGEALPRGSVSRKMSASTWEQLPNDYIFEGFGKYEDHYESAPTEAEARGLMWCWLGEKRII